MTSEHGLDEYFRKRDFTRTPEPTGGSPGELPIFVVQKHDATALHYDVRLEAAGVLKSWAVPKGPSLDPQDKRLAMPTEDHPMDYASFEGYIPHGEYGGGPVIVWDAGIYHNLTVRRGRLIPVEQAVELGHVKVWLDGEKLKGAWAFSRTRLGRDPRDKWLLVKVNDAGADPKRDLTAELPRSVLSGRTVEEVAAEAAAEGS